MTGRRLETISRMDSRVDELVRSFSRYAEAFQSENLFTGPSLYFHLRTLELLRESGGPSRAIDSTHFVETLYATLTAWGMHRMGPGGAKLVEFAKFEEGLHRAGDIVRSLETVTILSIGEEDVPAVSESLWSLLAHLPVSTSETKIVAASKTVHHLLPELVPPIDREYTLRFFYNNKPLASGKNDVVFREVFARFHQIARSCRSEIERLRGPGMNTSATKIIDNAIVGYVRTHLRTSQRQGEQP